MLSQYVTEGVEELDQDKLSPLLILRYNAISDAILELGAPPEIRAAAANSIREVLAPLLQGNAVPLSAAIWIVTARVS